MPLVSIIMPTFNRGYCLRRALRSVAAQTFKDWELIIVDDGSTDDTQDIICQSMPMLGNVRVFTQNQQGASAARNTGLRNAAGVYTAFLDSDDVWYPDKLLCQVEVMRRNPIAAMSFTNFGCFSDKLGWSPLYHPIPHEFSGTIYPDLLTIRCNIIVTPSVMARTCDIIGAGGFDEMMPLCEDLDLWRRVSRIGPGIAIRKSFVGVHVRPIVGEFPYWERISARHALYRKAIAEDPCLGGTYESELYEELFSIFAAIAGDRADSVAFEVLRIAGKMLNINSTEEIIRMIENGLRPLL